MATQRVGLIGDPVEHSRSPAMQNAAFQARGIAATYELWHTPAAQLAERVQALRDPAVLGANVTLPHKQAVLPFLDTVETEAEHIGAVNTIYKDSNGNLIGANTDAPALIDELRHVGGINLHGAKIVLLGASGAARAAAYALIHADIAQIVIANRTLARAEDLLGDIVASVYDIAAETAVFQPMLPLYNGALHDKPGADEADDEDLGLPQMIALELTDADLPDYIRACDVLINATSLGWQANETPFADPPVAASTLVYDMVYRPTRLLTDAQARGARTLDGLGMLVRQGALAFTKWTGTDAPLTVMRDTLERL